MRAPRFKAADTAQQVIGGFLLAGPFVVTEEVWSLAHAMSWVQGLLTAGIVGTIGYLALYGAATERDPDQESDVGGVPLRFVSLMFVSFGSVLVLALLFDAPDVFLSGVPPEQRVPTTVKALCLGAMFSVVGAATADTVF
ncbi:DUF2391 domain-containing protein [Halocatena pleomorpha]|uniref:DUF2391 domain-containing protein n=1 Tax=Halocatena pleomorpha TaxID=1785090 RepID=A0A3P3RE97_9EURY|nr:DUF2391 domain-containing protein [Halocatena pleomorpha]RRJ30733.1 DUF2391 domain-containing protein [Halocatena pleomorpha]